MKHTFLFEEGYWEAKGILTDSNMKSIPTIGYAEVKHENGKWINQGMLKLTEGTPFEYYTRSEINPINEEQNFTTWTSDNKALGKFTGKFAIIEDAIISSFVSSSANGDFQGCEYVEKIDDITYKCRGVIYNKDKIISTWAVQLEKK